MDQDLIRPTTLKFKKRIKINQKINKPSLLKRELKLRDCSFLKKIHKNLCLHLNKVL